MDAFMVKVTLSAANAELAKNVARRKGVAYFNIVDSCKNALAGSAPVRPPRFDAQCGASHFIPQWPDKEKPGMVNMPDLRNFRPIQALGFTTMP
jgi:hypothetical protein